MNSSSSTVDKLSKTIIYCLSFAVSAFLFWLIYFKAPPGQNLSYPAWVNHLDELNALLNSCTVVCLSFGYYFIKNKNPQIHERLMKAAFVFSVFFIISYIAHHHFHGDVKFQGHGLYRGFYLFILISHILLSLVTLPMVLLTFYFAIRKNHASHKKLAKWTFPFWMYVSVTGVMIYFLILSTL